MLRSLIAVFVVAGAAGSLFAGEPAVPPYGYTLARESCPKVSRETTLWDLINEKSWERMSAEDKRAALDEYCQHGRELFDRFNSALSRMSGALGEHTTLQAVTEADKATEKDIDFVCDHKIDGRSACKTCCQRLVTAHGRLIEREGELTGERLKEKGEKLQSAGSLRDARRLESAGITSEQMFENTGDRKARSAKRGDSDYRAAVEKDEAAGGSLQAKGDNGKRYEKAKKSPPAPMPGMTEKEAAYIREAQDSWMPGVGTIKGNLAKGEVEDMHAYVRNCYQNNPDSQWCYCKKMTTREIQDRSTGDCNSELLKRKLGQ